MIKGCGIEAMDKSGGFRRRIFDFYEPGAGLKSSKLRSGHPELIKLREKIRRETLGPASRRVIDILSAAVP
jgi:hypothetical protein